MTDKKKSEQQKAEENKKFSAQEREKLKEGMNIHKGDKQSGSIKNKDAGGDDTGPGFKKKG